MYAVKTTRQRSRITSSSRCKHWIKTAVFCGGLVSLCSSCLDPIAIGVSVRAFAIHNPRHRSLHRHQLWRDRMGDPNEDVSWRSSVTTAIGSSIAGLFRRKQQQQPPVTEGSVLGNDNGDEDSSGMMDEAIRNDFCEIEDAFGSLAWEQCVDSDLPEERRLVRVEDYPRGQKCPTTAYTQQQVWDKIRHVREGQSRHGCADLYPRTWKSRSKHEANFTVLQFNTLAEGLSSGSKATPPFTPSNPKESADYGGFSSVPNPETVFDFNQRKWRLLDVILGSKVNGSPPLFDIIALEEVDRFHGFFAPMLRLFGYRGIFVPKTNSPSARNGWYSDGCCLFWKDNEFELVDAQRCKYAVGTQVYLVATLQHRPTGQLLVVGVTHLKAQRSNANEALRCCQVSELLKAVQKAKAQHGENAHILVLGDFNADPPQQVEGTESAISRMEASLSSAYDLDDPSFYTSSKIRGNKLSQRAIDYVFYDQGSLECVATLDVPKADELEPTKLPGLRFPSDHLHVAAKFRFGTDGS